MDRVIVIDDDVVITAQLNTVLLKSGYKVKVYNNPVEFTYNYEAGCCDLILCDNIMPELSGIEVVNRVREIDLSVPIIMLTATSNVKLVINYFKKGISDYIIKPIIPENLIHRVRENIKLSRKKADFYKIEVEKDLIELENQKLLSWKNLYGSKDITQTRQMMEFFSRTINSAGGYIWLDMLEKVKPESSGSYKINKELYDLIVETSKLQRKSFDFISYISKLPEPVMDRVSVSSLSTEIQKLILGNLNSIIEDSGRELSINISTLDSNSLIKADQTILNDIILELGINSVKYSLPGSKIIIELYIEGKNIVFSIRNMPNESKEISYDYTELVFDLFYTLEAYTTEHPKEKWPNGTGLYISRELIKRMGGWITCKSVVDYTGKNKGVYVLFKFSIPMLVS